MRSVAFLELVWTQKFLNFEMLNFELPQPPQKNT